MLRFKQIDAEAGSVPGSIAFESFSADHVDSYLQIPGALLFARKFTRDEVEDLYVDHMQRFIGRVNTSNERVHISKIPLVSLGDIIFDR